MPRVQEAPQWHYEQGREDHPETKANLLRNAEIGNKGQRDGQGEEDIETQADELP